MLNTKLWCRLAGILAAIGVSPSAFAGEADIKLPDLHAANASLFDREDQVI